MISVIICTWNNSERLSVTLESFRHATKVDRPWELVIVDNNSTDDTKDVVRGFSTELPISYVFEPKQGLSVARNRGLASISGELVIFSDDDVSISEGWLDAYSDGYRRHGADCFYGGPVESDFESKSFNWELVKYGPASVVGLSYGESERELIGNEFFLSANWAVNAERVREHGGFSVDRGLNAQGKHAVCVGEEVDLQNRLRALGMKPVYLPDAQLRHFVPMSKCSRKHIGARAEAIAHDSAVEDAEDFEGPLLLGVPRWMIRKAITCWAFAACERVFHPESCVAYLRYRRQVGQLRGARTRRSRGAGTCRREMLGAMVVVSALF